MPRPFKHPKTGVYYFRVRVPSDLVAAVGKREVKISLGTKDPAAAKQLFSDKERQVYSQWKVLRSQPEPIPHKTIVALAGKLYHQMMGALENEPGEPGVWEHALRLARSAEASGRLEEWCGTEADNLLLDEGINTDDPSRTRLILETHRAFLQLAEQQLKRSQGDYRPDPEADRFPVLSPKKSASGELTLDDLFDLWKRDHLAEGKSARTVEDFRHKIDDFIRYIGHSKAEAVSAADVSAYVEHLRHERDLSAKTVHAKYLAAIRTIYNTGISKVRVKLNPTSTVKVKVSRPLKERSSGFTDDEATTILSCALQDPDTFGKMSELNKLACKWVPWICAYTGARAGEITQLRKEDFAVETGINFLTITPEAGSVKTRQYRVVPLHPHLIELGLLDFIDKRENGPLFFTPTDRKRKPGHTQAASVRGKVGDWVRDVAKVTDRRIQPNHAWRHRFKTLARDADIEPRYMDAIQGHDDGTASSGYGEHSLKALHREILKLPRHKIITPT